MTRITKAKDELLTFLTGENTLLDGSIISIEMKKSFSGVDINVVISLIRPGKERFARLTFESVLEYLFFYTNTCSFYNIERYKFFKSKKGFYISFDPFDEGNEISPDDQDLIIAESVTGEIDL